MQVDGHRRSERANARRAESKVEPTISRRFTAVWRTGLSARVPANFVDRASLKKLRG